MKEPSSDEIRRMLEKNSVGRNGQLSMLMKFANSFSESTAISIDGEWGSGKTVFLKQLILLNEHCTTQSSHDFPSVDSNAVTEFGDKYTAHYFNAWENDHITDPLQALLFHIMNKMPEPKIMDTTKKVASKVDLVGLVKNISKDAIDLGGLTTNVELTKEIKSIVERDKAVTKILDRYIGGQKKKLLFIIDELDRCKPSFAVELLEVIKHYFSHEDVVFIVATNTSELSHTIRKYYGYGFDGAKYLSKFFDYNMSLKKVDQKDYFEKWLGRRSDGYFYKSIPQDVAGYLSLSMREMNNYYASLSLLSGYMKRTNHWHDGAHVWLTQVVFVPLALGLRVDQDSRYYDFVSGKNEDIIRDFCNFSGNFSSLAERYVPEDKKSEESAASDVAVETYKSLFSPGKNYDIKEMLDEFYDVINLISSYSNIGGVSSEDTE